MISHYQDAKISGTQDNTMSLSTNDPIEKKSVIDDKKNESNNSSSSGDMMNFFNSSS